MTQQEESIQDYSIGELQACFLSREIEDRATMGSGTGEPIGRAALYLAALTRCPNIAVRMGYSITNVLNVGPVGPFEFEAESRASRWAEFYYSDDRIVAFESRTLAKRGHFVVGALQIDMYGNCNLIGIGDDFKKLKLRGPGGIGAPTMSGQNKRWFIRLTRHDKRTFVPKCDYISHVSWGQGGKDGRTKLGLFNDGPRCVMTPLCVLDFEENSKRMRLKYVHRGVSVQNVIENTGFELIIPPKVPMTPPPTRDELTMLRTKIDRDGQLRR